MLSNRGGNRDRSGTIETLSHRCRRDVTPESASGHCRPVRERPFSMRNDLSGRKFERLTAVEYQETRGTRAYWLCQCDCGNVVTVRGSALTGGNTRSCGCLLQDFMSDVGKLNGTHRRSRTVEYNSWGAMIRRCYNPKNNKFQYYGAKGVIVCDRWLTSFENFLADMGLRPPDKQSIDRFPDRDGNYEPTNCRWANHSEQNINRRKRKRRPKPEGISS